MQQSGDVLSGPHHGLLEGQDLVAFSCGTLDDEGPHVDGATGMRVSAKTIEAR